MKTEKEIQTAWEIWNLINRLNDLLFDRYEEEFSNIWLREGEEEEEDPFSPSNLPTSNAKDKTEIAGKDRN